jgi:hypothetical protein
MTKQTHGKASQHGGSGRSPAMHRLEQYAKPGNPANWQGPGRDQKNIDRWSERAARNSEIAPRASGPRLANTDTRSHLANPPKLPPTGETNLHSTDAAPRRKASVDAHAEGRRGANHAGSGYMKDVRRIT